MVSQGSQAPGSRYCNIPAKPPRQSTALTSMSRPSFSLSRTFRTNSQPPPPAALSRNDNSEPSRFRDRPASQSPPLWEGNPTLASERSQRVSRGMRRLEQRRTMEEQHFLLAKARAQNYNPPVDFRMLDYVSPYDDNLMCPICRCPFNDPVVLSECDHCFCRDCIRQCWNTNSNYTPLGPKGPCPTCRTSAKLGPRNAASKILVNITDELIVKCPKSEEGCKAEVKRDEVADHVSIYCGYALVECSAENCDQPVRRMDDHLGCLHYGVSCISCQKELQQWKLEYHWQRECSDRKVHCELCKSAVYYRELGEHSRQTCPAINVPCPGQALGCLTSGKREQLESHVPSCALAKLAPFMEKQQRRLDEQETAQKQMARKLEVLENGFSAVQGLLCMDSLPVETSDRGRADSSTIPLRPSQAQPSPQPSEFSDMTLPDAPRMSPTYDPASAVASPTNPPRRFSTSFPQVELTEPDLNWDLPPATSTSTAVAPYVSPAHHLLSLHENLREEMSRISTALSELDARHSMSAMNESLRSREEMSYLGAQVGGLQRQVHWLTSAQLQRQQGSGGGGRSTPGGTAVGPSGGGGISGDVSAGAGVEAAVSAVSTAATALRGAARVVSVGQGSAQGQPMRRRASEEGRTKL